MEIQFVRQGDRKIVGGVCAGIGSYFIVPTTLVRLVFLGLAVTYGVGLLLYLNFWFQMPLKSEEESGAPDPDIPEGFYQAALERRRNLMGVILFLLGGTLVLLNRVVYDLNLLYWPVLLLLGGLALFFRRGTRLRGM